MIYFDNAATTPVGKTVADAVYRTMTEKWGNPSAAHGRGREAELELDAARRIVRESLGVAGIPCIFGKEQVVCDRKFIILDVIIDYMAYFVVDVLLETCGISI